MKAEAESGYRKVPEEEVLGVALDPGVSSLTGRDVLQLYAY